MRAPLLVSHLVAAVLTAALVAPAGALAEPPANDQRSNASLLPLPGKVAGTVIEATVEQGEPGSCGSPSNSVWYRFTAPAGGRMVLLLNAAGNLDLVMDVFLRSRSDLQPAGCETTDRHGQAIFDVEGLRPGAPFLLRVAQRTGSEPNSFQLESFVPKPPAEPPGRPLPHGGATASVSPLTNRTDAWSVHLREGTTYRVNLDPRATRCVTLAIYPPGTRSFRGATPVRRFACGGYTLLTPSPGRTGNYILVVGAPPRARRPHHYHLDVAPAGPDDTAPGIFIGNHAVVRGFLHAGAIDVVDLYRFDVVRRSGLFLRLSSPGSMQMTLLTDTGRRLDSNSVLIRRGVPAGRYFAAIRTESDRRVPYTLSRISRTITRSRLTINGTRHAQAPPGQAVRLGVAVTPNVSGPVRVDVERFDPLAGWQFVHRFNTNASGGEASVSFVPPAVGRYRASGLFLRTRTATASATNRATLLVASPLQEAARAR